MCGIGGVYCFEGERLSREDALKVRRLSIYLEERGKDAYGFYNGERVIKFPSRARDVIEMIDRITPFENLVIGKTMFLIHTRASTSGDPLVNKNNHPFELKNIVFAHNGMMYLYIKYVSKKGEGISVNEYRKQRLVDEIVYIDPYEYFGKMDAEIPETDSFTIGVEIQEELNKGHSFEVALEKALDYLIHVGDMAIWVYHKSEDKLALFRCERPLYFTVQKNKLWFASEEWMLKILDLKKVKQLREGEIHVFKRDGRVTVTPIEWVRTNKRTNKRDYDDYSEDYYKDNTEQYYRWRDYIYFY